MTGTQEALLSASIGDPNVSATALPGPARNRADFGTRRGRHASWAAILGAGMLMVSVPLAFRLLGNGPAMIGAQQIPAGTVSLLGWLGLGLGTGFVARRFVRTTAEGGALDAMLAIVGAMAGGLVLSAVGPAPVSPLDIYGIFVAAIAATAVLLVHDAGLGRRTAA
jgi:uncharacterized membrane protein YeaQ/YmgE (transglycosylase-associated protein family)